MEENLARCARCSVPAGERLCQTEDGRAPDFCPTRNSGPIIEASLVEMKKDPSVMVFARQASIQEAEGYANKGLGYARLKPIKPRIQETIEFAQRMNYSRLGLVFCIGLRREAKVVERLLTVAGFDVVSAMCKLGRTDKKVIGIDNDQQICPGGFEAMCNPVAQAFVLNDAKTEFNILLGLCVGHDSLFLKYAEAMCTVLAAKDRLLGHNPLAAIYTLDSYYRSLK
ncbi:MAG: DUF1847 domain-containing protein [Desulfobacterales bacterium]|nr:DUF1847 domain-containing protein [Desulfobacterales bacterium]